MEQSKADPCAFRKVMDGEVTLVACVRADGLAVTAKRTKIRLMLFIRN